MNYNWRAMNITKMVKLILLVTLVCSCQHSTKTEKAHFQFPQGVASADPQPNAIMLWTRVVNTNANPDSINLSVEVSESPAFSAITISERITAYKNDDYTIRYYARELVPNKKYYYRFISGSDTSSVGRTFTAPEEFDSVSLNFATMACSSYEQGFYGTLKRLIEEDKSKSEAEQVKVIFHLGDFIYEVVGDDPRYDNHQPNWLIDANGKFRDIPPFPNGKQWPDSDHWKSGSWSPITVHDYRHLYKTYLSNPVIQEARARWPFVYTWDDHEFADGNYQSHSYIGDLLGLEGMQQVKVASNQAWFEYLPSTLSHAPDIGSIENRAYDFRPTKVSNVSIGTKKEDGLFVEENNMKAINSMCMYRALQWGSDVLIIVTDTKSYQDPGISVLGSEQKTWFKELLETSDAKWKLWLNSEPLPGTFLDYDNIEGSGMGRALISKGAWKSVENEREELLNFIKEKQITGVVSLSGDYHIQMASIVNAKNGTPVMADFTVTALSSFPGFFWLERRARNLVNPALYDLFAFQDDNGKLLPNINTSIMFGATAGLEMSASNNWAKAKAKADNAVNPSLKYFDCEHNGYLTGALTSTALDITFVNTENARTDHEALGAKIVSQVMFNLPFWEPGKSPVLSVPIIEGAVFPMSN